MVSLNLPSAPQVGQTGHVPDTGAILAALASLNSAKIEALKVGTVSTGNPGTEVVVSITGGDTLHIQIPRGDVGAQGPGFIIVDNGQSPPLGTASGTVVFERGA